MVSLLFFCLIAFDAYQKLCAWLVGYEPRIAVCVAKVAFQVMDGRPRVPHHAEPSHRIIYNISNTISYCTWLSGVMASSEMTMMQIGKIRKSSWNLAFRIGTRSLTQFNFVSPPTHSQPFLSSTGVSLVHIVALSRTVHHKNQAKTQ